MYHNFIIHSSVDGHLLCFHVQATVNSAQWTLGYMCLFQLWLSQTVCPIVGLLGHMVILFLVFKEKTIWKTISILFSIMAISIYIPINSTREFFFLHILSTIYWLKIFFDDQCEMIPHRSFDFSSNNEGCWASFHVFISHPVVFFGEMSV